MDTFRRKIVASIFYVLFTALLMPILPTISINSREHNIHVNRSVSYFAAPDSSRYLLRNHSQLRWRSSSARSRELQLYVGAPPPRRQKTPSLSPGGSSGLVSGKNIRQKLPLKKEMNRRETKAWDESCSRDKHDNSTLALNSMLSLWKDDLFSLQACDIFKPGNETANMTTPQPAIIINKKYQFWNKTSTRKWHNYCNPSSSRSFYNSSSGHTSNLCSSKGNALDLMKAISLPFCNHLTVWEVINANPDLTKLCSVLERNTTSPRDSCQLCSNEVLRLDKLATLGYCALEGILDRADCKIPYSPTIANCEVCKNVYRIWLCAQFFGRLRFPASNESANQAGVTGTDDSTSTKSSNESTVATSYVYRYPCPDLCHNVMKMCPYSNPIWDDANKRSGVQTLEPVEYSGWPAFHCPTTLPPYISEDESCYSYRGVETGQPPKLEIGQFRHSGSPSSLTICFHTFFFTLLSIYAL